MIINSISTNQLDENGVLDKYKTAGEIARLVFNKTKELINNEYTNKTIAYFCEFGDNLINQQVNLVYKKTKHKGCY